MSKRRQKKAMLRYVQRLISDALKGCIGKPVCPELRDEVIHRIDTFLVEFAPPIPHCMLFEGPDGVMEIRFSSK